MTYNVFGGTLSLTQSINQFGQKWKTVTGRQYLTDIIDLSSTVVTQLASKAIEFGEIRKIRAITPLKVIQGRRGRYQSRARIRLPISD